MINLRQRKSQIKVYFGANFLPYLGIAAIVCFASNFFINLHSQAKDYQKFRFFISTTYADDEKILNYVDLMNFDSVYEKYVTKYDSDNPNFDSYFSTQGAFNSDIFVLTQEKIDQTVEAFLPLGVCFKQDEFNTYKNVAIKIYDADLKEGCFKQFMSKEIEEDLYVAININSFHYLSSKEHCTSYAPEFIRKLING